MRLLRDHGGEGLEPQSLPGRAWSRANPQRMGLSGGRGEIESSECGASKAAEAGAFTIVWGDRHADLIRVLKDNWEKTFVE